MGMSGGVDSSVTVRILQQQGFGVMGAVIRFSPAHEEAVAAAHKAAQQLGVECITLDAQELFDQQVVQPFCQQVPARAAPPTPCVMCNPAVKFQALLTAADRLGIQYIATGHYARVELGEDGVSRIVSQRALRGTKAICWADLISRCSAACCCPWASSKKRTSGRWPGTLDWTAPMRRTASKICFVPDGDYAAYIAQRGYTPKAGHFLSPDGADLGLHQGVLHYTVGQRKGLGIALGEPVFVKTILPSGDIQLARSGDEYVRTVELQDLVTPGRLHAARWPLSGAGAQRSAPG